MPQDKDEKWSSEYDSTWEGEEDDKEEIQEQKSRQQHPSRKWCKRAAWDLQNYRHGYSEDRNSSPCVGGTSSNPNLEFYRNMRCFEPEGLFIDVLLKEWKDNYPILERNHYYIQWLFPLREYGMNSCAKPLTPNEIQSMKEEKQIMDRFIAAYKLMLGFYGIELLDQETGEVTRAETWEQRFKNLNNRSHNNLRITRILKCLGELGYERFQAPLVRFFLEETLCKEQLQNVKKSVLDYFMFTVKNKRERRNLVHFAWVHYKPKDGFMWGPVEKLRDYVPPEEKEIKKNESEGNHDDKGDDRKHNPNGDLGNCENKVEEERVLTTSEASDCGNIALPNKYKLQKWGREELIPMNEREGMHKEGSNEIHSDLSDMGSNNNSGASSLEIKGTKIIVEGDSNRKRKQCSVDVDEGCRVAGVEDKVKKLKLAEQSNTACNNGVDDTLEAIPEERADKPKFTE
ncbi:opioid growth factor receptor-like [Mixophyes fleayi]|uniref:opioid growth factor receptor-like n=1 Tax=Mixophyes fleayi TaxID=3061075 RepID=UPI003F4DC598